jgi:[ribosomal protein S18]-alanine N-acetyltransferase
VTLTVRDFQVRDFQPTDIETLWRIDQDCFPQGISYSRPELRSYIRRRGSFTLVAISAAESIKDRSNDLRKGESENASFASNLFPSHLDVSIAGFIIAEALRGVGHIITIDVIADARRHGVGSLLMKAAEQQLRDAGCYMVELETAVDNASALSFYKRHGYGVVYTFPRYYSNGVDALVLQKRLAR